MNLSKINNLLELFHNQYILEKNKKEILLSSLGVKNKNFSWQDTYYSIIKLSKEINKYVNKGDRCLIISENRPEWFITDLSIMLSGSITVPAYTTYIERDYEYIIDDCKPSLIFVSNLEQFNKIKNILKKKHFIKKLFSFENLDKVNENEYQNLSHFFTNLKIEGNILNTNIVRGDPACIIYTSGTQGNPKGVILSHGGILNNCEGGIEILKPITLKKKINFLTWLPLSHSYEHTVQFVQISVGARIFYAESIEKLIKNMNECNPDVMTAVPRFYQNLYQKINANFNKTSGIKRFFIEKMLFLGKKKLNKTPLDFFEKIQDFLVDIIVRKKIKKQFGGSLKAFVSGGGALDKEIGIFLNAIGLPTLQGYGLTETSPVVSCNPLHDIRIETVGIPFRGNKVMLAEDGEILVKGENVMIGYWNNKSETDKVLKDGWLYTGDIGRFENNYLKITDRKKDILITPGGDNISPVKIENELINSEIIHQAVVYGDNKPYLVALLILEEQKYNLSEADIKKEIEKKNKNLSKIEQIKKFFIVKDKFSIENGMLTPTLKLKRFKIVNKFKNNFEDLY
tara:strand:+ start:876 stop:2582 length:1707 start_codon:yes stop_codon:yes gene_type:complete